ncbi:MAG: DUF4142 domain-containing protein [Gemmataceae bacterium]|nr:DUF4142 domain-containing protein [Gemmataceae bacterium]MCI0740069.1 DUF4142 domain-containing protein [Gemmataceae bacterium]
MTRLLRIASVAVLCSLVSIGFAQEQKGADKLPTDTDFLVKAVSSGIFEVKISEHATKNANSADVKAFAERLATEHKKLNQDLLQHAKQIKTAVVTGLEKDKQAKIDQLNKLSGAAYDREFMKQNIEGHEASVKLFKYQSEKGQIAELRKFAQEALPTIERHLKEARAIAAKLPN